MADNHNRSIKATVLPPVILALVCAVCCGLLALANSVTADKIAAAESAAIAESLQQLPEAGNFTEIPDFQKADNEKAAASALYVDDKGQSAVLITADGYNKGGLQVIVGVDKDGAVTGVSFVSVAETPGLGTKVRDNPELLLDALTGCTDTSQVESADAITGATFSSNGIKAAIICALETAAANQEVPEI